MTELKQKRKHDQRIIGQQQQKIIQLEWKYKEKEWQEKQRVRQEKYVLEKKIQIQIDAMQISTDTNKELDKLKLQLDDIQKEKQEIERQKEERRQKKLKIQQQRKQTSEEMRKLKYLNPKNYEKWNSKDVVEYICKLNEDKYIEYYSKLLNMFEKNNINGKWLSQQSIYHILNKENIEMDKEDQQDICAHLSYITTWNRAQTLMNKFSFFEQYFDNKIQLQNIQNVLVISVGIVEYEELPFLIDVPDDLENYVRVFQNKYGYSIISNVDLNHNHDFGYHMTYEKLNGFLLECRSKLINTSDLNVINDDLLHEGIIITISSHGIKDGIICSDGLVMSYTEIRSIFGIKQLANIPRIYLIDACCVNSKTYVIEDAYGYEDEKNSDAEVLSVTIVGNSEGRGVRGGLISKYITETFSKQRSNPKQFGDICDIVQQKISKASNKQQTLKITQLDKSVFDVIFKSNNTERGCDIEEEFDEEAQATLVYDSDVYLMLTELGSEFNYYRKAFSDKKYTISSIAIMEIDDVQFKDMVSNEKHRKIIKQKAADKSEMR
eukprot:24769_1